MTSQHQATSQPKGKQAQPAPKPSPTQDSQRSPPPPLALTAQRRAQAFRAAEAKQRRRLGYHLLCARAAQPHSQSRTSVAKARPAAPFKNPKKRDLPLALPSQGASSSEKPKPSHWPAPVAPPHVGAECASLATHIGIRSAMHGAHLHVHMLSLRHRHLKDWLDR